MELKFWKAEIDCPRCSGKLSIFQEVLFSADGEFSFTANCEKCNQSAVWRIFGSTLSYRALVNDMEVAKSKNIQQEPVKLLAQPEEEIVAEDAKYLRELGIGDPPDNEQSQ